MLSDVSAPEFAELVVEVLEATEEADAASGDTDGGTSSTHSGATTGTST
jgi:hypothetical protein